MVDLSIFFGSVVLMALTSRGLLAALHENVALESLESGFSRRAIRLGRQYKIMAWGLLTGLLLGNTVYYFTLVFLRF